MTREVPQILVIEDDTALLRTLRVLLEREGYRVSEATSAARAEIEAGSHRPDLLLVDLGLPDADGLTVIRHVRTWSTMPMIVVSARHLESQKIAALDAGADDYITKPFSSAELLARVRAGLRRRAQGAPGAALLALGPLRVDLRRRRIQGPQGDVHLTPLEYRILECLARQSGMVVRQRQLLREVWGPNREHDVRSLRVCIKSLRDKLEPDPRIPHYLITVTGLGYRLSIDEVAPASGSSGEQSPGAAD
jgi:two-component system, OmpR family, KDP operon response regulator KdpE